MRVRPRPASLSLLKIYINRSPLSPCLAHFRHISFVFCRVAWALSYLSDGSNNCIQAVIEAGVCRRLVELMLHPSFTVQTPALRTCGNIVTGDDVQTQVMINVGVLPCFLALLTSPKKGIRKEACWAIRLVWFLVVSITI